VDPDGASHLRVAAQRSPHALECLGGERAPRHAFFGCHKPSLFGESNGSACSWDEGGSVGKRGFRTKESQRMQRTAHCGPGLLVAYASWYGWTPRARAVSVSEAARS
jgi:hypothetical protein